MIKRLGKIWRLVLGSDQLNKRAMMLSHSQPMKQDKLSAMQASKATNQAP